MTNKDIVKQYVDTGICIPEYQMDKLNEGLLKTYLRKRIISVTQEFKDNIKDYEYLKLNNEQKIQFLDYKVNNNEVLTLKEFLNSPEEFKTLMINTFADKRVDWEDDDFDWKMGGEDLGSNLNWLISQDKSDTVIKLLLDNKKFYRILNREMIEKFLSNINTTETFSMFGAKGERYKKEFNTRILHAKDLKEMLTYSQNPEITIKFYDGMDLKKDFSKKDLLFMFMHSYKPKSILKIFGESIINLILNISEHDVQYAINNGQNIADLKEIFDKYDIEYEHLEY
jgi:hypothetical protein